MYLFCPFKAPKAREASYEPFLAERAVEKFIAAYVEPSTKDLCYCAFYADETSADQIVMEAQTLPFLAERRVLLVRNSEKYYTQIHGKSMIKYLESPCESTVLLLITAKLDKRAKFYKACQKAGEVIECPTMNQREAIAWAKSEVSEREFSIAGGAAQALVERSGTNLSDVANAISLVCGYLGNPGAITEEDVRAACSDVAEDEIWALTDAIATSNTGEALRVLRNILELGKSEPEIMGTINWLLKSAYAVAKAEEDNKRPAISPFVAGKVRPLANKLGLKKIRDAFALCLSTELMLRSTGVDNTLAIELLTVKLAAPRGKRPAVTR